ncbi:hypothetical protein H9660_15675 [Clostridium sp. Sa3CUN1]|uniref:Spo0E like sporulation regulatory protein n=1 Tax=Clostridium gallinarum TaxID=2762246 RepID=A0ABR8Q821_9CLOT|nr:hypothetical protein [Clostridium gallinarum]MBD7916571.1 hypothetical protein [Clostridium gallinarum]
MSKKDELEQRLTNLKLEKRELVLAGKSTNIIDELIKEVENELENIINNKPSNRSK